MQVYEMNDLEEIIYELKSYRAVMLETDTQLGIVSIDPKIIYFLKKRPKHKQLIRFIYDAKQIKTDNLLFYELADRFWPGKLTLIINNISYRIPNHPLLLSILKEIKTLYSSSANISSMTPLKSTLDAFSIQRFRQNEAILVLVNGISHSDTPSTIFNVDSGKILRRGVMYEELVEFLKHHKIKYNDSK